MKRSSVALVLAALLVHGSASAQDSSAQTAQAKTLFNAGAQAYEAGQFPAAIQAFEEAYRLAPRSGILFSMAQAHRKQFFVSRQPMNAREAVRLYRQYIAMVQQGGRRGDAVQALSELEPIADKLGPADGPVVVQKKPATRVSISVQAKDPTVTLDGKPVEAGIFHDVTPGKHAVHVTAPGYFPEDREVPAAEGGILAVDVAMREQPGLLTITALDGADVAVDGRSAATTPLARPIELPPGVHFVAVTRRGYRPYAEDVEIGRGESKAIHLHLEQTNQRLAAYTLFGVAAASVVAGGVLGGVSFYEQSQAQSLNNARLASGNQKLSDATSYGNDLSARNDYRAASVVAFGAGVAIGITGVLLAVFDQPNVNAQKRRDDGPRSNPGGPARDRPLDLAVLPVVGPGSYGLSVGAHF